MVFSMSRSVVTIGSHTCTRPPSHRHFCCAGPPLLNLRRPSEKRGAKAHPAAQPSPVEAGHACNGWPQRLQTADEQLESRGALCWSQSPDVLTGHTSCVVDRELHLDRRASHSLPGLSGGAAACSPSRSTACSLLSQITSQSPNSKTTTTATIGEITQERIVSGLLSCCEL